MFSLFLNVYSSAPRIPPGRQRDMIAIGDFFGDPLEVPWGSLGGPLGVPWGPLRSLGGPLGVPWGSPPENERGGFTAGRLCARATGRKKEKEGESMRIAEVCGEWL